MEASATTVVVVANHSTYGIVTQAFNPQLVLQGEQHFASQTTGASPADLLFYDLDLDGTEAYAVLGCPDTGVELTFMSTPCG